MAYGAVTDTVRIVSPDDAETVGRLLLDAVDDGLAQPLAALYLTGSAALDDYVPGVSDVDFVGVVGSAASGLLDRLAAVHAGLAQTDGIYVTAEQLRTEPAEVGEVPHARDGRAWLSDDQVIPVTWHTLACHGVAIRGPAPAALGIRLERSALKDWCRGNLRGYWAGWARAGSDPSTQAGRTLLTDWGVAWCVLGVLRLAYTIQTGEITSKRGAGRYGLATLPPRWHPLVSEAIALRESASRPAPPADPVAAAMRRGQAVALMRSVIAGA